MDFDKIEFDKGVKIGTEAITSRSMARALLIVTSAQKLTKQGTQAQLEMASSGCAGVAVVLVDVLHRLSMKGSINITAGRLPDVLGVLAYLLSDMHGLFFDVAMRLISVHKGLLAENRNFDFGPVRQIVVSTSAAHREDATLPPEIRYRERPHAIMITLPGRESITTDCPEPPLTKSTPLPVGQSVERTSDRARGKAVFCG